MSFVKWTDIEGFHNVRKAVNKYEWHTGPITYRGKIKLHGTNAGITVKPNGDVFAQSRTSTIGTGNDNAGFAAWVESTKEYWSTLQMPDEKVIIFGEWCGPGIQKGVAINSVEEKQFAIFAVQFGDYDEDGNAKVFIDPYSLSVILGKNNLFFHDPNVPKNMHILPWYGEEIELNFFDIESLEKALELMNKEVEAVEVSDPWVKDVFGVDGTGEGLVYYPISFQKEEPKYLLQYINRLDLSRFMFKAKGEKHKVVKTKKAVQLNPEVAANVDEFVKLMVTEARLEQAVRAVARGELVFEKRLVGPFIGWISKDINKESEDELEASGLTWKEVSSAVASEARRWYLRKFEEFN